MEIRKVKTCDLKNHKFSQDEMMSEFKHCLDTTSQRVNNGNLPLRSTINRMLVLEEMLFDAED